MCRNIRRLHHFQPPATPEEIQASALQYVRKLTGMPRPSKANEAVFNRAVRHIVSVTQKLFDALEVHGPPHTREAEAAKAVLRGEKREALLRAKYGGQRERESGPAKAHTKRRPAKHLDPK
jgi:hypothetical protein